MRSFHQNLLLLLAACLCALCVRQWYVQSIQGATIESQGRDIAQRDAALRSARRTIVTADRKIAQMDALLTGLRAAARSNELTIAAQEVEVLTLQATTNSLAGRIADFARVVEEQNARLTTAYAAIEQQNSSIKLLIEERDALAARYNETMKDRNDVVEKYNALVKQMASGSDVGQRETVQDKREE